MKTPEKDLRDEIIGQLTVALEQEKKRVYELLTQLETVRTKLEEAAASTKHKGYWI